MMGLDAQRDIIVFVAPCPLAAGVVEGWMARMRAVDEIFRDVPRVYLDPFNKPAAGKAEPRHYGDNVVEYRIDPLKAEDAAFLEEMILRARFVYVHTAHLGRYLLPYYPTGKIVTDMHGIVPEEERMLGNPAASIFYEGVERVIMLNSRVIVVVTEAMRDHLLAKHPESSATFIVLPITELSPIETFERRRRGSADRYRALYAGGAQVWQNIDLMLTTAAKATNFCDFEFLSQECDLIRAKAAGTALAECATFGVCGKDELPARYAQADFGFVLRDDTAVNNVSCPTKLSEYLWFGLIPIIKSPAIGDFPADGFAYLTADEFAAGLLPNEAALDQMRRTNRGVIDAMNVRFKAGAAQLSTLSLKNGIVGDTLAGLPIGTRYLQFPTMAELYLFGGEPYVQRRTVIDLYDCMNWDVDAKDPAWALRLVPMVADITAQLEAVDITAVDAPVLRDVTCTTAGFARRDGLYLEKSAPYFQINFPVAVRVVHVAVRWRLGPLGARERGSMPDAPKRKVELTVRNSAGRTKTAKAISIQCEVS